MLRKKHLKILGGINMTYTKGQRIKVDGVEGIFIVQKDLGDSVEVLEDTNTWAVEPECVDKKDFTIHLLKEKKTGHFEVTEDKIKYVEDGTIWESHSEEKTENDLSLNDFRRFTKSDWYGWGGCEKFSDGTEPLINNTIILLDGDEVQVVIDKTGIGIYLLDDQYFFEFNTEDDLEYCLPHLQKSMTTEYIEQCGFENY